MKKQTQKKSKKSVKKARHYPPEYLALILAGVLILEGALFGISTNADWQRGTALLDLTPAISEMSISLAEVFEPVISFTQDVNQFYQLAANEITPLLDLSDVAGSEVAFVYNSVYAFYHEASVQMEIVLGISNVAEASIYNKF
jgi:hypothetical protein